MIYLFTWNSRFLIKQKISKWKNHFISKYWDFNLVHIKDIELYDNNFLVENICSTSFLWEKKLILIDLIDKLKQEKQILLLSILDKIPNNNILAFSYINPDKRTKFYKEIVKKVKIEEFIENENNIVAIIKNKFSNKISISWINLLIKYKSFNLDKIINEIKKLLITINYIEEKDIIQNIFPELEESIFQIIDNILNKNIICAILKINILLNQINIYAFYNSLIANLRINTYISKLKNLKKNNSEISKIMNLWNRDFLINKNYIINNTQLQNLYCELIKLDKKMKSWKLIWTTENDFKFEIEKVLISL